MTKTNERHAAFAAALDKAHAAATTAVSGMVENTRALNCGMAWVVVHDRAFMTWCRKQLEAQRDKSERDGNDKTAQQTYRNATVRYGDKHHSAGWCFWKPGNAPVQQVDIHEAGAKAFSETLAHELQIRCEWSSRLD